MMPLLTGYAGTYFSPQSTGVYRFTIDTETGALSEPELLCEAPNAKYISVLGGLLAAPIEHSGHAGVFLLNLNSATAHPAEDALTERTTPCFVTQDETHIYTANYHEGHITIYDKKDGKPLSPKRIPIGEKAGCHQVLLYEHMLLVPCLERDKILLFDRHTLLQTGEIAFSKGSGPRHGIFTHDHSRLYVVCERGNTVHVFEPKQGSFHRLQECSVLPADKAAQSEKPNESAAIRLSPDERFLYTSTRGADLISVFSLEDGMMRLLGHVPCGGEHPRDFLLTPDGRFLIAANRFSNTLVSFFVDPSTGFPTQMASRVSLHEAVSLALAPPA